MGSSGTLKLDRDLIRRRERYRPHAHRREPAKGVSTIRVSGWDRVSLHWQPDPIRWRGWYWPRRHQTANDKSQTDV